MFEDLNQAIGVYRTKWEALIAQRSDKPLFEDMLPTAVAWKTEDLADFDKRFAELRDHAGQIHLGWVNERWLATFHLRNDQLAWGVQIVKLMQRRPGSADATGLDHIDFLLPSGVDGKAALQAEPELKWSEEKNGDWCKWLSIWFDGTEAKLRAGTTLEVCIKELQAVNEQVVGDGRK
jgi:plasmid maintenance system killer protein